MLSYKNVLVELKKEIPEFKIDAFFEDSPALAFNELSTFVIHQIRIKNFSALNKIGNFFDQIISTQDPNLDTLIDEFVIALHGESKESYNYLKQVVPVKVSAYFNETISLWNNQSKTKQENRN